MGKLKDVLSRRILWFSRRRFETASVLAIAVVLTLACQESTTDPGSGTAAVPGEASPVQASRADTLVVDVSVAVGDTSDLIQSDAPYGPPLKQFANRGQTGDVTIADVIYWPNPPASKPWGNRVIGIAEGSTTWIMVWDDYSQAPYQFYAKFNVTVTAATGPAPVVVPVERMLVAVGGSRTKEVGYEPTVTLQEGEEGIVTAAATSTGATFTGVSSGSATYRMEWTDGDSETQTLDVALTVFPDSETADTVQVEIGETYDIATESIGRVTVAHLDGSADAASVEAYHEGRTHGVRIVGEETGVATWSMKLWAEDPTLLYIEVLSAPSMEELTVQVGEAQVVELGSEPTVNHMEGAMNVVRVEATATGANLLGLREGAAEYLLSWNDDSQLPAMQRRTLSIIVPAPPPPSLDSVTIEEGGSHTVKVGYEPDVTRRAGEEGIVRAAATATGATFTALTAGEATFRMAWADSMDIYRARDVAITVPVPEPPDVDSITVEVGESHMVDVGYEPSLVTRTSGDDGVATAETTSTGATFTAVAAGSATFRMTWAGEGGVVDRLDVVVTVPTPPPPLEDSPVLAVGDTIYWSNHGLLPYPHIAHVSGAAVASVIPSTGSPPGTSYGVRIIGLAAGTGVYRLQSFDWQCPCNRERDLHITVLSGLPDGQEAVDLVEREFSVKEGDTVYVRAILREAAKSDVSIPVTVTAKPIPDDIRKLAYDWESNDSESDYSVVDGAAAITIERGEQYGVIGVAIKDDDLIEPASSEVFRVEVTPPAGVKLVSRGSWLDLRIAEGVCDRTHASIRSHYVTRGLLDSPRWIGTECHELEDKTLDEIRTFVPRVRGSEKPSFKVGDFAGLTGTTTFGYTGPIALDSQWDQELFKDLDSVETFWLDGWQLAVLRTEMFEGINSDVEAVRLKAADEWDDPDIRSFAIELRVLNPFRNAKKVELLDFPIAVIDHRLLNVLPHIEELTLSNFEHLSSMDPRVFRSMSKLKHLTIRDMPALTDRGMPNGLLSNQKSTLTGLELLDLGLTGKSIHTLFGNESVVTKVVNLDLAGNGYASTESIVNASSFPDLAQLHLERNQLESLHADGFSGLTLETLHLDENPGSPFAVASELEVQGNSQVRAKLAVAMPTEIPLRVYGQNIEGNEFSMAIPAGVDTSGWKTVAQSDTARQVLLRAVLSQQMPDEFTSITVGLRDRGAGEAILYRKPGQGGNRLPIIHKEFPDLDLYLGSTTNPKLAEHVFELDDYVTGKRAHRPLTFIAAVIEDGLNPSPNPPVTVAVDADARTMTVKGEGLGERMIILLASDGPQTVQFRFHVRTLQLDGDNFNIQLVKLGEAASLPLLSRAIDRAAEHWESVIVDAPDVALDPDAAPPTCRSFGSTNAGGHTLERSQTVIDDIVMVIAAVEIDGSGGTLASASICARRGSDFGNASKLPVMGRFVMDAADLDYLEGLPGGLEGTILHEMGHLLGVGVTWYAKDPVGGWSYQPSGNYYMASRSPFILGFAPNVFLYGSEIAFLGANAYEVWQSVGGSRDIFSLQGAPIATTGGGGSFGVHWSEVEMEHELMTPFKDNPAPLSAITQRSLMDLGWTLNPDYTPQAYTVPGSAASRAEGDRQRIDLSNDVHWLPVEEIGRNGRVTGVVMPPENAENRRILDLINRGMERAGLLRQLELDRENR